MILFLNIFVVVAGIMFQDVTTLLLDPKAFKDTVDMFVERYRDKNISVVAGNISVVAVSSLFGLLSDVKQVIVCALVFLLLSILTTNF